MGCILVYWTNHWTNPPENPANAINSHVWRLFRLVFNRFSHHEKCRYNRLCMQMCNHVFTFCHSNVKWLTIGTTLVQLWHRALSYNAKCNETWSYNDDVLYFMAKQDISFWTCDSMKRTLEFNPPAKYPSNIKSSGRSQILKGKPKLNLGLTAFDELFILLSYLVAL